MKNHLIKLVLLLIVSIVLIVSCSKEDENKSDEPYIGYYNFKDTYDEELLLKIANSEGSVSYYGSTDESGETQILASLYKNNATGRRIIYKVNSTRNTSIVFDFDKPDLGGILFIEKGTTILVQEFEFVEDNKTIKPTNYIKTISTAANRLQQTSNTKRVNNDDGAAERIDESVNNFHNDLLKELIVIDFKSLKSNIDNFNLKESWDYWIDYSKNKLNKNPEPFQEKITEDPAPDPNMDSVKPLREIRFDTCRTLAVTTSTTANSAKAVAIGGEPPYTSYLWSNGNESAVATDLEPGTYTVTVTDNRGCSVTGTAIIEGDCTTSTLTVTTSATSNSATAIVTGGQSPYTYLWSNGDTNATAVNLTAGTYTVAVTDKQSCIKTGEVVVVPNNEYWRGSMIMLSHTMIQDCPDNNANGINDDCGTGGCQSGTRALFGSLSRTSASIKFAYSTTHSTNNFQMALVVGGSTTVNLNTCYTANIQPNQNFNVGINYFAPDRWGGGPSNNASLQDVNFVITNQTSTTIEGIWSGNIRVSPLHCVEACSGIWNVNSSNIPFLNCDIIPSN